MASGQHWSHLRLESWIDAFRICLHWACGKCGWMARRLERSRRPRCRTNSRTSTTSGLVAAVRMRMRFDVWRFPFGRVATDNVRQGVAVTRQTGQVLTPTAAPDGDQIAFLSDSGGHSNLWVISTRSGELRQITFEDDAAVSVGVPVWSPDGSSIAFVSSKGLTGFDFGVWVVNPDGSNLRNLARSGLGMAWSPDGKSLYYADTSAGALKKVEASGGTPVTVRSEPARNVIGLSGGDVVLHGRAPARRWAAGVRNPCGHSRGRPVAPARADSRVARAKLADRQSFPLARRTMAGAAAHRWLHHQHLGALHRERRVAAGDRFRRPADLHRAPGVLVARWQVHSRGHW